MLTYGIGLVDIFAFRYIYIFFDFLMMFVDDCLHVFVNWFRLKGQQYQHVLAVLLLYTVKGSTNNSIFEMCVMYVLVLAYL